MTFPRTLPLGLALLAAGCGTLSSGTIDRPGDRPALAARGVSGGPASVFPGQYSLRVSQYVFFADFPLDADLPLFRELSELRDSVTRELRLPASTKVVQVYLFEDRDRYERFMGQRYPELPRRRAFFVAQPQTVGGTDELMVFTYWGDRLRQDLRHELTHALLHAGLKDVPLWLDEGLAEYFELPPENAGVNAQHLDAIKRATFTPDMGRLEAMTQVQQMTPAEYREAWAWTHWMLRASPEGRLALLAYLQQLRTAPTAGSLQAKIAQGQMTPLADQLEAHLTRLSREAR